MTELAIHTTGLGKRFGDRVALESIDLAVPRGVAFGFLGPNGFLLKDARPQELVGAVRAVAAGDAVLSAPVTRRLLDQIAHRLPAPVKREDGALAELTDRELEVLRLLAGGLSNAEIAGALVVSDATVKNHVSNLLGKLGLRDRVQAVILAYETGLVSPR
jgi:DNA-binding NarL/FixJ family response regulator